MTSPSNTWISCADRLASWEAYFDARRTPPEQLLRWLERVLAAGEREEVYSVERNARLGYDRATQGGLSDRLRERFERDGTLHLFDFEMDGCAPGDWIGTRIARWSREREIAEDSLYDLGEILRPDLPDDPGYSASRSPLEIEGTLLETRDPSSPWHPSRRSRISVYFALYTDIWFPLIQGLAVRESPRDPCIDNRALAERHTPRLNRFLAEARRATLDVGGDWAIDQDFCDPFLLYAVREDGIDLSATPAVPAVAPRPDGVIAPEAPGADSPPAFESAPSAMLDHLRMPFQMSLSGPDTGALLGALIDSEFAGTGAPDEVLSFGDDLPGDQWLTLATEAAPGLELAWSEQDEPGSLIVRPGGVVTAEREEAELDPTALLGLLEQLPFEIAVVGNRYADWGTILGGKRYAAPTPAPGHTRLGLALALRGAGHERLVSERWLDHGPWALIRRGDLSLVLFHDPDADPVTALAQAQPGHSTMGPGPDGGWVHPDFQFSGERSGLYDDQDREYIWVLMGRVPEPWELLEHAAVRNQQALGRDKPVERVALVMPDEAEARPWVHACWLREIDLRTMVDGVEVSLTADYRPSPPSLPNWVRNRIWLTD